MPHEGEIVMAKSLERAKDRGGTLELTLVTNPLKRSTPFLEAPMSGKNLEKPKGIMLGKLRTPNG